MTKVKYRHFTNYEDLLFFINQMCVCVNISILFTVFSLSILNMIIIAKKLNNKNQTLLVKLGKCLILNYI